MNEDCLKFLAIRYATEQGYLTTPEGTIITNHGKGHVLTTQGHDPKDANKHPYFRIMVPDTGVLQRVRVADLVGYQKFGEQAFIHSDDIIHSNGDIKDSTPDNIELKTA